MNGLGRERRREVRRDGVGGGAEVLLSPLELHPRIGGKITWGLELDRVRGGERAL